ncbi:MAG: tRNA (guanosine(46)-N7)-methyltransferase TrmB [Chitinispirillales bacterium]|jgi:tRNA (guanine-N7-)-methyltransferase|nr:tRNA (guanosine(46)-N7)-methyltransferase TrmB [Chitinispirillales bacterium]
MRLRNIPYAYQKLTEFPDVVIQNPIDFKGLWAEKIFGNKNGIHVEIGAGRGKFIINSAMQNPGLNFIGIEKFDSVLVRALKKNVDKKLTNLRFIKIDAQKINDCFAKNEIEKIYLNFSDPWSKTVYEKRRLTSRIFLEKYKKILAGNGILQFKTDNVGLFEFSVKEFNNFGLRIDEIRLDLHNSEPSWNIRSEYEEKFAESEKKIFFIIVNFGGKK